MQASEQGGVGCSGLGMEPISQQQSRGFIEALHDIKAWVFRFREERSCWISISQGPTNQLPLKFRV